MVFRSILSKLVARDSLTTTEAEEVFGQVMAGALTPSQIGALLAALAAKGEVEDEILGAVRAMRAHALPLPLQSTDLVDTCGTGGDAQQTFNISTAAALIAAGAGVTVAKHGNRAMSGLVGAADVLEGLGVRIDLLPAQVARCIDGIGVGFVFAQTFHPAMKHAAGPRRELGIRTIFNLLGPLASPAGAQRQLIGVYSDRWLDPMASVLQRLGSRHVMVVHSEDGLDEISLSAPTRVVELHDGRLRRYTITPSDLGFECGRLDEIRIDSREAAVSAMRGVLAGDPGPLLNIALANAGAAIYVAGRARTLASGVEEARRAVESGAAAAKLQDLIEESCR